MADFGVLYLPKISASLSILCSSLVIAEVLNDIRADKARSTTRILLSVSICDILYSL